MIAHFYLLAESFHNNANFSKEKIEEKIKHLFEDIVLIDNYKETNKRYVNYTEILPQILYSDITVQNVIYREKQGILDKDVSDSLRFIIDRSSAIDDSFQDVQDKLNRHNENDCYGLIAFHKIDEIDENLQIIYGIDGWYKFRRYFLSLYPKNEDFFIEECTKYFPNLYFHERNKTVISHLLKDSTRKLVHYLSELNGKFDLAKTVPYDREKSVKRFNSMCTFDQDASDEGSSGPKKKSKVKKKDTFKFLNANNEEVEVCCDLHLKILKDDRGVISTDRRIYFHEGKANIQNGKILIGHVGCHI